MRLVLGVLMVALAVTAAVNAPNQIRNADRRAIIAWPAAIHWPDPAAIAWRRFVVMKENKR